MSFKGLDKSEWRRLQRLFQCAFSFVHEGADFSLEKIGALLPVNEGSPAGGRSERGRLYYEAIHAMVAYFVSSARDTELSRVKALVELITGATLGRFGHILEGLSVDFKVVSSLEQVYWSTRADLILGQTSRNKCHRVIRINDIPFAEAIFPALLAERSSEEALTVIIENVSWEEVGDALVSGLIDVALYPPSIVRQVMEAQGSADRPLLFKSASLLAYWRYPIIRNKGPVALPRRIAAPDHSDFKVVAEEYKDEGIVVNDPLGDPVILGYDDIEWAPSADDVAALVVNGEIEYGLVGGLQAAYTARTYSALNTSQKSVQIVRCGDLERKGDNGCRFWTLAINRTEAEKRIRPMVKLWNNAIARRWNAVKRSAYPEQQRLLALVNTQSEHSFVSAFSDLIKLIEYHDHGFDKECPISDISPN